MKRTEKELLMEVIKHLNTARLRTISAEFNDWDYNNHLKKAVGFGKIMETLLFEKVKKNITAGILPSKLGCTRYAIGAE